MVELPTEGRVVGVRFPPRPSPFLPRPARYCRLRCNPRTLDGRAVDDAVAKALFDAEPHNHPEGNVPNWEIQPEAIKDVFRRKAAPRARPLSPVHSGSSTEEIVMTTSPVPVKPEDVPANVQFLNIPEWYITGAQILWAGSDPIILFNKIIPVGGTPPGVSPGVPQTSLAYVAPVGTVRLSAETLKELAGALQMAVAAREKDIGKPIETEGTRQQAASQKKE